MKWCIIGAGGIADRRTIPAILKDPESEIAAVMDRNADVAEKIGLKYGVKYYSDENAMLDEYECDAVYIGRTLGQEETGEMLYLYAPQGEYDAQQSRVVAKPRKYRGKGADLYLKQIEKFKKIVTSGKNEYEFADEAVHVQKIVEMIYKDDEKKRSRLLP